MPHEFDEGDLRLAREFAAAIRSRHPGWDIRMVIHDLLTEALASPRPKRASRAPARADLASAMGALAKQAGFRGSGEIELPTSARGGSRRPKKLV